MKWYLAFLILFAFVQKSMAQESEPDSTKDYSLKEVVVTATRSPIPPRDAPSHLSVLTASDINNANGATVGELLSQAGNYFIRTNGGGGSISTISMRGGASEHALVLINGVRYNNFQNGLVDLSLLPLQNIERIEMVGGGNSPLYGADALSGVLNLITRQPPATSRLRAEYGASSFQGEHYLLEGASHIGRLGLLAGYSNERGRDDYTYPDPASPDSEATRMNNDFSRRQLYIQGEMNFDTTSHLVVAAQGVSADRGSPGPTNLSAPSQARLFDSDINVSASYSHSAEDILAWDISSAYHYSYETYNDPGPAFPYQTFYKNRALNFNPQIRWPFLSSHKLIVGGEFMQGKLEGPDFDSQIVRVQKAIYLSEEDHYEADRELFNRFSFYTTIRYDYISDVVNAFTPKFGVNIRACNEGDLRIRSSIGKSFRSPSFNDLYFKGFNNPDLKPEYSTSFDAGISSNFRVLGNHSISVTYFNLNTVDRILFDQILYVPVNIGKVRSIGVECSYLLGMWDNSTSLRLDYSYTNALKENSDYPDDPSFEKQLTSVPKDILNLSLSQQFDRVKLNLTYSLVGERYITADNSSSLPAYRLVGGNVIFRPVVESFSFVVKGEVQNIFDVNYQIVDHYPMPGRNYRLTIGVGM